MDKVFLKQNPAFFSRLGFCYDPPLLDENGEPIVFSKNFEKYANFHKDMLNAGVKIQTCIVHAGWVGVKNGVNQYDYSLTDKTLDVLQGIGEDAYLLPRVKLNVPVEWCRENPEEVFVYPEGPRMADQIKELVGTLRQDWLGYNSPKGYYQAQEYEDKRPNVDSLIGLQSLSSKKWLQDAGEALKNLIAYLKTKPYYDRIIGFHICFGPCGENMQWGRQSRHYGDYGISNLRNFYEYGLRKYGSIEVLSEKWQQEDLSPDNVDVPNPEIRYWRVHDINTLFRGKQEDIICKDFDEFLSKSVTNAIDYFGGIVKQETQNKLVGAFYGYFLYVANPSYAGHLDLDGCLASKNIDFLAAPKPYYRMLAGEPNGDMTAVASVNLDKVWMEEIDCRTNLIQDESERHLATDTFDETFYVFWRNVCKNISQGSGFWWMDLGGGWFNSPIIHQEIKKINDFLTKVGVNGKSVADILIVVDEKSIYGMRETKHLWFNKVISFIIYFNMVFQFYGAMPSMIQITDLLGLRNTWPGIFIMKSSILGGGYLFFHVTFRALAKDYSEAAIIDGANHWQIMVDIVFPLAKTIILVQFVAAFITCWNDYQTPLIYLNNAPTAAYGLFLFSQSTDSYTDYLVYKLAGFMLLLIPTFTVFMFLKKYFLGEVTAGGVKE